jgi:hypothetical protein
MDKLHKRTIRIPAGTIIQMMTPQGKIVAEFHDQRLYTAFMIGLSRLKTVSVYDEDTCQFLMGTLDQLVATDLAPTLRRDAQ